MAIFHENVEIFFEIFYKISTQQLFGQALEISAIAERTQY